MSCELVGCTADLLAGSFDSSSCCFFVFWEFLFFVLLKFHLLVHVPEDLDLDLESLPENKLITTSNNHLHTNFDMF